MTVKDKPAVSTTAGLFSAAAGFGALLDATMVAQVWFG
jgi:hypothetical protein